MPLNDLLAFSKPASPNAPGGPYADTSGQSCSLCFVSASLRTANAERRIFIVANDADGYGIDRCLALGAKCGTAVANAYCKRQSFAEAATFHKADQATLRHCSAEVGDKCRSNSVMWSSARVKCCAGLNGCTTSSRYTSARARPRLRAAVSPAGLPTFHGRDQPSRSPANRCHVPRRRHAIR